MIRWKVYKQANSPIKARNNLMNFRNWSKAVEHIAKKLGATDKPIRERLETFESAEIVVIERRR